MPSPFPGMDPFIESQAWEDFHHAWIETVREWLISMCGPDTSSGSKNACMWTTARRVVPVWSAPRWRFSSGEVLG